MAEPPPPPPLVRRLARRLVRRLLGASPPQRAAKAVHDGPLSRLAAEAIDATVPKNASGNNASVR